MDMELSILLRIFSIACAGFFALHMVLLIFLSRSLGSDRLLSEAQLSARWLRCTVICTPILLFLYWMVSYASVQQQVLDSLRWFLIFDFVLFLLTLLFRVIGVLRIKTKTDTFRSMMGKTAGWLTAGMLLTLVVHFFLTGVPG